MKKIKLTDDEKEIVRALNDPVYTIDYLEHWINRNDKRTKANALLLETVTEAKGFYAAIKRLAQAACDTEVETRVQRAILNRDSVECALRAGISFETIAHSLRDHYTGHIPPKFYTETRMTEIPPTRTERKK